MSAQIQRTIRERVIRREDAAARAKVAPTYEWQGSPDTAPGYFDARPGMTHAQRVDRLETLRDAGLSKLATNLQNLNGQALDFIERQMLNEARDRSHTCGKLFSTRNRCDDGRVWVRKDGDPTVWMAPFKAPGMQIKFNRHAGQHREDGRWVSDGFHLEEVPNQ